MKLRTALLLLVSVTLLIGGTVARAVPSCTDWMAQPSGVSWRTCVDDNGKQYCQEKDKKGKVTKVKC